VKTHEGTGTSFSLAWWN